MANNRYYLWCPCGEKCYLGKSRGDGIYNVRGGPQSFKIGQHEGATVVIPEQAPAETFEEGQTAFIGEIYKWMWKHLMSFDCVEKRIEVGMTKREEHLSPEWVEGEVFKVLTEYDERV